MSATNSISECDIPSNNKPILLSTELFCQQINIINNLNNLFEVKAGKFYLLWVVDQIQTCGRVEMGTSALYKTSGSIRFNRKAGIISRNLQTLLWIPLEIMPASRLNHLLWVADPNRKLAVYVRPEIIYRSLVRLKRVSRSRECGAN